MPDSPEGAEILGMARDVLLKELLPLLPPEKKYQTLMVANAMAISGRELDQGDEAERIELRILTDLYGEEPPDPASSAERIAGLNARLAADIRAGLFDGDEADRLRRMLLETVVCRLRIWNPKYPALADRERKRT
jgi:hypothetical protein